VENDDYRKLILRISKKYSVGLHPSFYASDDSALLLKEKQRLQSVLSGDILISRFHYIKIYFPDSYRNLIKAGINEDYSMGYPEEPGFRAGISRPFFFYDLLEDRKSGLRITPFQLMDGTLIQYKGMTPETSVELITGMIDEIQKVGGLFVSIWHNTSLLESPEYEKWRNTFELMLKLQKQ
jgi:hypothetical protein